MAVPPSNRVRRVLAATDRSRSADYAVAWAAELAERFGAELVLLQVLAPGSPARTETGAAEATRASYAARDLEQLATELAGTRGSARVVVDEEPARAIVDAAEREAVDLVIVGNVGMSGRKEFLLGNVPNRVSHGARCSVVIVNSVDAEPLAGRRTLGNRLRRRSQ